MPRYLHAVWFIGILVACLVAVEVLRQPALLSGRVSIQNTGVKDVYKLAREQSDGFFDDIHEKNWKLLRERVRMRKNHCVGKDCFEKIMPHSERTVWYGDNFEPDFTCTHERRIGGKFALGDGPKWVCDPHRIAEKKACLVYSVGSHGNFLFEDGIHKDIYEGCEIHTFDEEKYGKNAPSYVQYHPWLLAKHSNPNVTTRKTMAQTVRELGHEGRTIDIFKIDCEGCEWWTFNDWITSGVYVRQILVEVHNKHQPRTDMFFETMQRSGYVTFHKEPNIGAFGTCVEYALVKLGDSFFEGMEFLHAGDAGVNQSLANRTPSHTNG